MADADEAKLLRRLPSSCELHLRPTSDNVRPRMGRFGRFFGGVALGLHFGIRVWWRRVFLSGLIWTWISLVGERGGPFPLQ